MKIIGITRVRNEEKIIKNTLDHVANFVDSICVVDDASTDKTPYICFAHPAVSEVYVNKYWDETPRGRNVAEGNLRQIAFELAMRKRPDWIYYFDADEYADLDGIDFISDAYRLRLFDFYITPEDVNRDYTNRQWMGPEYRDILMLFRAHPDIKFHQREPNLPEDFKTINAGFVKHYGKAISIEEWGKTCEYYINYRGGDYLPKFTEKWKARRGQAIHYGQSDFGNPLIKWEDRFSKAIPLID